MGDEGQGNVWTLFFPLSREESQGNVGTLFFPYETWAYKYTEALPHLYTSQAKYK